MSEDSVIWRLGPLLDQQGLSVYKLAQNLEGQVSRTTLYAIARGETKRVDCDTLAAVLDGLEALTGQHYEVGDLLTRKA